MSLSGHTPAPTPRPEPWRAPPPSSAARRGLVPPRFEAVAELGRGGAGVVLQARDRAAGGEVALKLLLRPLDDRSRRRFAREAEVVRALDHPGIVRLRDAELAGPLPWLAYELIPDARTLEEALPTLPPSARIEVLVEVALALAYAHERGVVHRDLKPANVLLDPSGRAHLTDFGAALASGSERLTQTGTWVGTPSYMAPEQLAADRGQVVPATDVWALGVLLYEALTDRLPFSAASALELAVQVVSEPPPPPRRVRRDVDPRLDALCLRALRRDPASRPADGAAFAEALEAVQLSPGAARRRRGLGRPVAIAAGLALVAGGAAWGVGLGDAAPAPAGDSPSSIGGAAVAADAPAAAPDGDLPGAAAAREPEQWAFGWRLVNGDGVPKDVARGARLIEAAARLDPAAMRLRGLLYRDGLGVPADRGEAIASFHQAIAGGELGAWLDLGQVLMEGDASEQAEARQAFAEAAARGDAAAMRELGLAWSRGAGGPRDRARARTWLLEAAAAGDVEAANEAGLFCFQGIGGPRQPARGVELVRRAAEAGGAKAASDLGAFYASGWPGQEPDEARARALFGRAAEAGDVGGIRNLALFLKKGRGGPIDAAAARRWYRRAVDEHDDAPSRVHLGVLLRDGVGGPRDVGAAMALFRRAAEQGDPQGLRIYGTALLIGEHVAARPAEAVPLLQAAAQQGDALAWVNLSFAYSEGRGVARDYARALAYARRGAALGHPQGWTHAGYLLANGLGVETDGQRALSLWRRAAAAGERGALLHLGKAYHEGELVEPDAAEARRWLERAAAAGQEEARALLDDLEAEGR